MHTWWFCVVPAVSVASLTSGVFFFHRLHLNVCWMCLMRHLLVTVWSSPARKKNLYKERQSVHLGKTPLFYLLIFVFKVGRSLFYLVNIDQTAIRSAMALPPASIVAASKVTVWVGLKEKKKGAKQYESLHLFNVYLFPDFALFSDRWLCSWTGARKCQIVL